VLLNTTFTTTKLYNNTTATPEPLSYTSSSTQLAKTSISLGIFYESV